MLTTTRNIDAKELEPGAYNARQIVRLRKRLRVSQGVFAVLVGVSTKAVQAWEQGANPAPAMARRLFDTINDRNAWAELLAKIAISSAKENVRG